MPTIAGASRQISGRFYDKGGAWANVKHPDFGAKGDGRTLANGAITTGTPNFTSASNPFTSADAGKSIVVVGAGAAGVPLVTTILTYVSAGAVTLAANAGTTVAAAPVLYGTDDSAAIQAAINSGFDVLFPAPALYCAHGLTQSAAAQKFAATGPGASIAKNANGALLTVSGNNWCGDWLGFRGESSVGALTGDNVTITGNDPILFMCGSRWANGRAVKATGDHVQINGTCDIYQTVDATATGYDIEIGTAGVNTGYHAISFMKTSQSTGGLLIVDAGGHTVEGCQIGKLYIKAAGASTANGGKIGKNRITGNVNVELSGATFTSNQFGVVAFAFAVGTSGCVLDKSNTFIAGATIANNGNANNVIEVNISTGSVMQLRYGPDSSPAVMQADQTSGEFLFPSLRIKNNKNFTWENAAAGAGVTAGVSVAGDWTNSNLTSGAALAHNVTGTGSGSRHQFMVAGVTKATVDNNGYNKPSANGANWIEGEASELLTLSTVGTTTDTSANLLPADAIISGVVARVTTTITTATDWKLGDATTAGRFAAANATMTAGATSRGTVHLDQTGAAGPRQTAAAKVRVTTTGTPGAGVVRITVYYRQFVAPTS